jgi:DNA-binding transcriptional LysR family regulator
MQTDYLRYFIDVATLGSMNAAAKKNYMSPQGVSRSISALENELGCELFQRDSNKVTLTPYGERLLHDAHELLERERQMRRSVVELRGESLRKRKIQFTCYCSPIFFDTPLLFPASGLNTAIYGKVQFLQRSTPKVVDLLLDAARMAHPNFVFTGGLGLFDLFADENAQMVKKLIDAGYEYRPFMRTSDYVLVPAYSSFAREESLTKTQIRSHPLAVAADGGMERAITRHIGSDSIYVSSGDSAYRCRLCRMGEALTFVPGVSLVFGVPEGTVAVPMAEPYTIEVGFAAPTSAFDDGVLADAIGRLTEFYSKYHVEGAYELLDGSLNSSIVSI